MRLFQVSACHAFACHGSACHAPLATAPLAMPAPAAGMAASMPAPLPVSPAAPAVRGVHDVYAGGEADAAAASGFALANLAAAARPGRVLWVRQKALALEAGDVEGAGLTGLGLDPARLILMVARDGAEALQAGLEGARCAGLGGVIIELWARQARMLDLTASRRLVVAARANGVPLFLNRVAARQPHPSAADTRWQVAAAPSQPLGGHAPGRPAFHITLLRQRSGPGGQPWIVEWDRDSRQFIARDSAAFPAAGRERPALSGTVVSFPSHRPVLPPAPRRGRDEPLVLVTKVRGALCIAARNRAAAALGLGAGLGLADARVRCATLRAESADPLGDQAWLMDCARAAEILTRWWHAMAMTA